MAALFPPPKSCEFSSGSFFKLPEPGEKCWFIFPQFSSNFFNHLSTFRDRLKELYGFGGELIRGNPAAGLIFLRVCHNPLLVREGYRLQAQKGEILLEAGSEAGAFYGLKTLEQLLDGGKAVREFSIDDAPAFPDRGIMLDISRCKVPTLKTLKKLIRMFSRLKINQLQLYMEHTFAFSDHFRVWEKASPLSAEEILLIEEYCQAHYMELVPNFNSFGHFERWLRYPEYTHLAECPDGFLSEWGESFPWGTTLKPDEGSVGFLDSLYREFLPNFQSNKFNAGCDETWELGQGASKEICQQQGSRRVYLNFLLSIHKLVTRHNKQMMFWGDIILKEPALLDNLPEDMIPLIWGYEGDHDFDLDTSYFRGTGRNFYVCPGTSSWNSIAGRTDNCLKNLENAARQGLANGATGYLITDWGDKGHHQYLPVSYTGFTAGAGFAWNPQAVIKDILPEVMDALVFEMPDCGFGELFYQFGNLYRLLPGNRANETLLNRLLFHDPKEPLELPPFSAVQDALKKLDWLEEKFEQICSLPAISGSLELQDVAAEFFNGCRMCRFALNKALFLSGIKEPGYHFAPKLEEIIRQHEILWKKRNRSGGLEESSLRLKVRLEDFRS